MLHSLVAARRRRFPWLLAPASVLIVAVLLSPLALIAAQAERILAAGDTYEYPARPGIAPNSQLTPLSQVKPAVLTVVGLGNDLPAASLLQQAGLT